MLTYRNKKLLLTLLALGALALQVTAVSTQYWATKSAGAAIAVEKSHWGLWRECTYVSGTNNLKECSHLPPSGNTKFKKNSLETTRAFAIMGPLFVFISLLFSFMYPLSHQLQCLFMLLGALSSVIAMIIFSSELLRPFENSAGKPGSPGYSFYLNLAGGVTAFIAAFACWQS